MRVLLAILVIVSLALPAAARGGAAAGQPPPAPGDDRDGEILLVDGTLLSGRIVAETDSSVTIETTSLGRVEVPRTQIRRLARAGTRYGVAGDPDRNSILLTPTPVTVGKGRGYFRSFELIVLNGGYGLSDRLDLSVGALFPIAADWNFIALGLKYRLIERELHGAGLALTGSHLVAPEGQRFSSLGAVLGFGDAGHSVNFAVDRGFDEDGDAATRFMIGADAQISRRSKLFAEYANSQIAFSGGDDDDDEFDGFITVGFRLFGESMAFTLGGFRPLIADELGDFIAFPMLMFSAHW